MTKDPILHLIRESDAVDWFDIGWKIAETPASEPGSRIIEWSGLGKPVAPFTERDHVVAATSWRDDARKSYPLTRYETRRLA
jgi:hypothetical protein